MHSPGRDLPDGAIRAASPSLSETLLTADPHGEPLSDPESMRDRQYSRNEQADPERTTQPVVQSALPANVASVIRLQAVVGNAAVAGLLRRRSAPTVQRLWDTDDESGKSSGDEPAADEPAADDSAIDAIQVDIQADLDPDSVVGTLAPYAAPDEELGDFEVPDNGVTAQALLAQRDGPTDEAPPPKAGSAGDVIKALMPYLKPAIDFLKQNVLDALAKIKAGEAVATVIVAAPIVIGPLTQPGPRRLALDQLDGTDVTFGLIPHLQLKPQITDGQLRGGTLTYDLAPALRKAGIPF